MKTIKYIAVVLAAMVLSFGYAPQCRAAGLTIGDENVWIIIKGVGTSGKISVPVIITDPNGRRMGYDPRIGKWIIEFDAGYDELMDTYVDWTEESEQRYKTDPEFRETFDRLTDIYYDIAFNLIPGEYAVEAIGKGFTEYRLSILMSHYVKDANGKKNDITSKFSFTGVIDKGLTSNFKFTYNPNPAAETPGTIERIVASSDLKQDIELSRSIGWIDNDGIAKSLLKKAEAIEAAMARGDNKAAENQLNAFINEVDAQKGKHIESYSEKQSYHKEGGQLVPAPREGKAVKLLLDDAQYLLDSLGN